MTTNLKELHLSILSSIRSRFLGQFKVPETLHKLHLEFTQGGIQEHQSNFNITMKFLNMFKDNLTSLTLIAIIIEKNFSDYESFHRLVNNFTHLETFEYFIRTNLPPNSLFANVQELPDSNYITFTIPQPQPFDYTICRTTFELKLEYDSHITLPQLLYCSTLCLYSNCIPKTLSNALELNTNIKLSYLKEISFVVSMGSGDIREICQFFSKLIHLLPNLHTIAINTNFNNTIGIIEQLKELVSMRYLKQIRHFRLESYCSQSSLLRDLSKIFPNLITLRLPKEVLFFHENTTTLLNFVEIASTYFPRLIRLTFYEDILNSKRLVFANHAKNLNEQQQIEHPWHCTTGKESNNKCYYLSIWL
ncbi:unnamed protein product [Adineta steineri]|uniref:Uncharacterized protein n=1 Tax=Adineta steineri TaxID=433720 RepID=A0A813SD32_9BILA|nr:unnamed protein product [Adineta steineri]CAF0793679.1 unnamed protein product [Adineta steineri]